MFFGIVFMACACPCRANPTLPNINTTNVFNITNAPYNAISGTNDNTAAIQAAINAAGSATGGGTVEVPVGTFLSGPLTLKSKINLQIDSGGTLKMLPYTNFITYPNSSTYFIMANKLSDLEISGSGTIDGQGLAWWTIFNTNSSFNRPNMIYFNSGCQRVLVQNVTLQNAPAQHLVFKGTGGNITIQNMTVNTPVSVGGIPAKNTDGIDLVGTNCLVQNCTIGDDDDNIAFGSSGGITSGILVTNCTFGTGHGVSVGSDTSGGVSNIMVFNCTFNGTTYGIRLKSDQGKGGLTQNLSYFNLGMTNVEFPIVIYGYYEEFGTPNGITPAIAAAQTAGSTNSEPIWRNITISNVTATAVGGSGAGIIWGRTEMPITNVTLQNVHITAPGTFDLYNVRGFQFIDSQISVPAGNKTFTIYNASPILTNDSPQTGVVTFGGLAGTNSLSLYNSSASMSDSNALGANPITVSGSTLSVTGDLTLSGSAVLDYVLGSSNSQISTSGNLTVNGTINVSNGVGFGANTYTLLTYHGALNGTPVLGATPAGFTYGINTLLPGSVNLVVQSTNSSPPGFATVTMTSNGLVMSGTNGPLNGTYVVLTSTNASLPLNQWTPIATNHFDASGNFAFTNVPSPGSKAGFYVIQLQ